LELQKQEADLKLSHATEAKSATNTSASSSKSTSSVTLTITPQKRTAGNSSFSSSGSGSVPKPAKKSKFASVHEPNGEDDVNGDGADKEDDDDPGLHERLLQDNLENVGELAESDDDDDGNGCSIIIVHPPSPSSSSTSSSASSSSSAASSATPKGAKLTALTTQQLSMMLSYLTPLYGVKKFSSAKALYTEIIDKLKRDDDVTKFVSLD